MPVAVFHDLSMDGIRLDKVPEGEGLSSCVLKLAGGGKNSTETRFACPSVASKPICSPTTTMKGALERDYTPLRGHSKWTVALVKTASPENVSPTRSRCPSRSLAQVKKEASPYNPFALSPLKVPPLCRRSPSTSSPFNNRETSPMPNLSGRQAVRNSLIGSLMAKRHSVLGGLNDYTEDKTCSGYEDDSSEEMEFGESGDARSSVWFNKASSSLNRPSPSLRPRTASFSSSAPFEVDSFSQNNISGGWAVSAMDNKSLFRRASVPSHTLQSPDNEMTPKQKWDKSGKWARRSSCHMIGSFKETFPLANNFESEARSHPPEDNHFSSFTSGAPGKTMDRDRLFISAFSSADDVMSVRAGRGSFTSILEKRTTDEPSSVEVSILQSQPLQCLRAFCFCSGFDSGQHRRNARN